jgi:hypothetical protein
MDGGISARKRQSGDSLLNWASSATFRGVCEKVSLAAASESLMLLRSVMYQGVTGCVHSLFFVQTGESILRCVNRAYEVGLDSKLSSSNLVKIR